MKSVNGSMQSNSVMAKLRDDMPKHSSLEIVCLIRNLIVPQQAKILPFNRPLTRVFYVQMLVIIFALVKP